MDDPLALGLSSLAGKSSNAAMGSSCVGSAKKTKSKLSLDTSTQLRLLSDLSLEPLVKRNNHTQSLSGTVFAKSAPSDKATRLHDRLQRLEVQLLDNDTTKILSVDSNKHVSSNDDDAGNDDEVAFLSRLISIASTISNSSSPSVTSSTSTSTSSSLALASSETSVSGPVGTLLVEKIKKDFRELSAIRRCNRASHQPLNFAEGWRSKEIAVVRQYYTLTGKKAVDILSVLLSRSKEDVWWIAGLIDPHLLDGSNEEMVIERKVDGSEAIAERIADDVNSVDEAQLTEEWRLLKMTIDDKRLFAELLQEYNSPDWQKHRTHVRRHDYLKKETELINRFSVHSNKRIFASVIIAVSLILNRKPGQIYNQLRKISHPSYVSHLSTIANSPNHISLIEKNIQIQRDKISSIEMQIFGRSNAEDQIEKEFVQRQLENIREKQRSLLSEMMSAANKLNAGVTLERGSSQTSKQKLDDENKSILSKSHTSDASISPHETRATASSSAAPLSSSTSKKANGGVISVASPPMSPLMSSGPIPSVSKRSKKLDYVVCPDISYGKSPFPIPAVNIVDDEPFPPMKYVDASIPGPGVEMPTDLNEFLPGCNCLSSCTDHGGCICKEEMGGKFPYDEQGNLQLEVGWPIYECNSACSCDREICKNRVVQKGPFYPLEIFKTVDKGWAVRTLVRIPKNRFVCEYLGELITTEEAEKRGVEYDKMGLSYLYDLDVESKESCYCIDATTVGNVARFINHSCNPNLQNYQVWIDSLDKERPRIAFFSRREIQSGEEITFDYKYERLSNPNGKRLPCRCGAKTCRKFLY